MCSTNNTNEGGDSSPTTSSSKKLANNNNNNSNPQKRKRVPKRGPGVAELEKILKQQKNDTTSTVQGHFSHFVSSSSSSSSTSFVDHYLQNPHHQRYFPFPSPTTSNTNDSNNNIIGRFISGSSIATIEEGFVSSMMNNYDPMELPSSQTAIGFPQPKFLGVKRSLPVENNQFELPSLQSDIHTKKQRSGNSISSCHGLGFINSNFNCKPLMPREEKWEVPRESDYLQSYNAEMMNNNGVSDSNFVKFISPNSVGPVMMPFQAVQHQFPKFDLIPFQGNIRDCLSKRSNGSDTNKPFFSFFPLNDQRVIKNGAMIDLDKIENKGNKSGQDVIDLNLKLSTT